MPELAEVEFYRRRWASALRGAAVARVHAAGGARPLRGVPVGELAGALVGGRLTYSGTAAKQMLFRFGRRAWLGLHLGMSGDLRVQSPGYVPGRHDHLVLFTSRRKGTAPGPTLVYSDPRRFGRVRFELGDKAPGWWAGIAPAVLSPAFSEEAVAAFLARRARSPIKSVLLLQERFPGVGNWMADEILWRAAIAPKRRAGSLRPSEVRAVWRQCRWVCRQAIGLIAEGGPDAALPKSWLMPHRWKDGGRCPRTGRPLRREVIGGRTTCWSPARQA